MPAPQHRWREEHLIRRPIHLHSPRW